MCRDAACSSRSAPPALRPWQGRRSRPALRKSVRRQARPRRRSSKRSKPSPRLPTDENGPGAAEARAAHYIDRALAGPLRSSREAYAAGLAALDVYAQSKDGALFARLSAPDQDAILADMEKNVATGFVPNAATFFNLVRAHTIQGTFCDPYYGGNANFVGWDLIGFPGLRMAVGEDEQRMKAPKPVRKSAYEDAMFTMKGGAHGHRP